MLEEHEASHTGGIKCAEPLCSFSRIGFKNSAALKRHTNEFHTRLEMIAKPAAVRRQFVCGGRIPNRWGCAQRFAREDELKAHFSSHLGKRCIQQQSEAMDDYPEDLTTWLNTQNLPPLSSLKPPQFIGNSSPIKPPQDNSGLEHMSINSHNQEHSSVVSDPSGLLPFNSAILSDFLSSGTHDYPTVFDTNVRDPVINSNEGWDLTTPQNIMFERAPPKIKTAYNQDQEYFGKANDYPPDERRPLHEYVFPKKSIPPPRSTPTFGATNVEASPRLQSIPTPGNGNQQWNYYPDGRTDAPYPQPPGSTPVSMISTPDINTTTDSLGFSNLNFSCLSAKQQSY